MKLTKRKLIQLIEAFISGPDGTVNLDAQPYEFMQSHPDPRIANLAKTGPAFAQQAAMLSSDPKDMDDVDYEDSIRSDPAFNKKKYKKSPSVGNAYAHTMSLYDSDPNFESNLKQRVFDYIGDNIEGEAQELAKEYFHEDDAYSDVDYIIETESHYFTERLAEEDPRFDLHFAKTADREALAQHGRKSIDDIIKEAYKESGLVEALYQIYDYTDFG